MATQVITTANKPIAADISTARKQFLQSLQTMQVKGANLENATDAAAMSTLAGVTNGTAMRDILVGITELVFDADLDDTVTVDRAYLVARINYIRTLINQYA